MTDTTIIRKFGGWKTDLPVALIKVRGEDANRYLQSQTTNDVNALEDGDCQRSCFLDRKAKIVADFTLFRTGKDSFTILCDDSVKEASRQHLDKFKFSDKVEFEDIGTTSSFLLVEGRLCRTVIKNCLDKIPTRENFEKSCFEATVAGVAIQLFKHSTMGAVGYILAFDKTMEENILAKVSEIAGSEGFEPIDDETLETGRIEAGILKYGIDYDSNSLLPETSLQEECVDFNKGCFQGQEVLARVRSHGAPTKAIVGLTMDLQKNCQFDFNASINLNDSEIGWIKSFCSSEYLGKNIAIALMKRDYREPGKELSVEINNKNVKASVNLLPFYKAPSAMTRAKSLYEQALSLYTSDNKVNEAVEMLKEAISLNPLYEDAYESLGVILSKNDSLDEAIEIMQHLSEINPDSIMAHTNLSVFYLDKGWKEKAEEEKAISTTIAMLKAAREAKNKEELEKEKEQKRKETEERLSMFEQVLEIDAEDFLANYGKGSCLVELESYKNAIPYLAKALDLKDSHTVAYLDLAKAYIAESCFQEAEETLTKGMSTASRQGNLEPLKKMQLLMDDLKQMSPK